MDYTKEINAFYDWLETNTLTYPAIVLWHALMHTCNRAGWPDEFTAAISTLSNKSGLQKDAINRARLRLQQTGRIDFRSKNGNQSAVYRLIPFHGATLKPTQSERNNNSDVLSDANRAQSEHKPSTNRAQSASINKDLNISSSPSAMSPAYESFYQAHERVFGFECNPFQAEKLGAYIDQDGMDEQVVIRAIERAGIASVGYSFNFITRILDDYFKGRVRTLQQAIAIDTAYDARQQKPKEQPATTNKASDFADRARRERERENVRS